MEENDGKVHRDQAKKDLGYPKDLGFYPEDCEGHWWVSNQGDIVRCEPQKDYSSSPSVEKGVKIRLEARRPVWKL